MNIAAFKASLSGAAPAPQLDAPLAALWWAANDGWDRAHQIVPECASDQIRAGGCEGEFSSHSPDSIGPEQLPLLTHKKEEAKRDDI